MTYRRVLLASTAVASVAAYASNFGRLKGYYYPIPGVSQERFNSYFAEADKGDVLLKRAPDSEMMLPYWEKVNHIIEGYDAVRNASTVYLPMFTDEDSETYALRKSLTKFTNVFRDIVEGLSSKPFEEKVTLGKIDSEGKPEAIPKPIEDFIVDVDGAGTDLTSFAAEAFFNGITNAIDWIFVDFPKVDRDTIRTKADEEKAGVRPLWSHILAMNVLEARTKVVNGEQVLVYIRWFEPGTGTLADCVRVFERLDEGAIIWALYEKQPEFDEERKTQFARIDGGQITIEYIPVVPFVTGRRDGTTFKVFPVMRDAADLQIELYQQESGLKFAKTLTAYPMLAGEGIRPEMMPDGKTVKKLAVGPNRVLYAKENSGGKSGTWKFIEPSASSLTFLAQDIKDTINQLRELGRQPLTAQSGNLTVITTAVAAGKARSAVGWWAIALKVALENALWLSARWLNMRDYDPVVNVYNEFDNFTDDGKDVDALLSAREKGDISRETLWTEFKRRKVLSSEFNAEAETTRLLNEVPNPEDDDDQAGAKKPALKVVK